MNIRKNFVTLLCLLLFSSCGSVKIKDSEFCGDMGTAGASCFKTLSGETRDVHPNDWDEERFGMICSKADTFADWKKAILKLCKMSRRCKYESKKKIKKFGKAIESFQLKITDPY